MLHTPTNILAEFIDLFTGKVPCVPAATFAGVSFVGDFAQLVLLRSGNCQAQLCLCKPNSEIPDHGHPNVEQALVYVTGEIDLRLDGKPIYKPEDIFETPQGLCSKRANFTIIAPGQSHGATIGKAGGAFITLQHWLKGSPSSVEMDWVGENLGDDHEIRVPGFDLVEPKEAK